MSGQQVSVSSLAEEMRSFVTSFEAGTLRLDRLAWELKSRIAVLRDIGDAAWADELKSIWNHLEVINAVVLGSGRTSPSENERKELHEILVELVAALTPYG
jgi:hypothetical protein